MTPGSWQHTHPGFPFSLLTCPSKVFIPVREPFDSSLYRALSTQDIVEVVCLGHLGKTMHFLFEKKESAFSFITLFFGGEVGMAEGRLGGGWK